MGIGIYFSLSSFIIILILTFIFYSKGKVENIETKTYSKLLFLTLVGLFLEITSCLWHVLGASFDDIIYQVLSRLLFTYYMFWGNLFLNYLINICNVKKILKIIINVLSLACLILILILPMYHNFDKISVLTTGPAVTLSFIVSIIYVLIDLLICLIYRKKIDNSKFTPVYTLICIGGFDITIGLFFPSFFLMGYVYSLIVIIMYFTIENPDIKMLEKLEIAKSEADKANKAKSDFLKSISHEIRTPLNSIIGFSEDIESYKDKLSPEVLEDTNYIISASKALSEIIGDVLDIEKIENNIEITGEKYNLNKEIESIIKIQSSKLSQNNITFKVDLASDLPYELIGNRVNIKKIVNNLLSNAINNTHDGLIELSIKCINQDEISNLIITIKDNDEKPNETHDITQIKTLVEKFGGKINIESIIGQGSICVVNIPQKISKLSKPMEIKDLNLLLKNNSYNGKKILIVEDNDLNIKVLQRILKDFNIEITICHDGQECLDKVKLGNEFDLILMDIMMPNMNGESALSKLKDNQNFKIPTIALTADALIGAKEKYLKEGFADYIVKPFNKEQIIEKLDKYLK